MTQITMWWVLTGIAIVLQLLTGTFHFLILALGFLAGAVTAQLGGGLELQMLAAALGSGGCVPVWYMMRRGKPRPPPASANPNVNMDIGSTVQIDAWNPDGTASTHYRGANWEVMHRPGVTPSTGAHRVVEVIGSRLVVEKIVGD